MMLWPSQSDCLIIGHRGAMGYAPENTLASFEEAIRRGADCLECDVQLTRDGDVVVMHDTAVDRTTNGDGLIRDLTLKKIKTFDAGAWYSPEFAQERIPTLSEMIHRFRNRRNSRRRPVGFIIEMKTVKGSGGALADAVVQILKKESFIERAMVISFDMVALQEVHVAQSSIPIGLLYSEEGDGTWPSLARQMKAHALFPRKTCITAKGVAAAHKAGLAVATWTANTKNEMKRLLACGVDAITTNYPDRLRSLME